MPGPADERDQIVEQLAADATSVGDTAAGADEGDDEKTTVSQLRSELDTLANHLRTPAPSDEYFAESGCQRAMDIVEAIGREPSFAGIDSDADAGQEPPLAMTRLGQYQLLARLGQGGMGTVYKALHTKLDKVVALKVLPADAMQNSDAVARFEREMRAVGKLQHPNIVAAHDAGEIDGTHYLVMELVEGVDLSALVRRTDRLPVPEACELIRQAALGLQHAHEHGLVHRDIKPSNLMISFSRDAQRSASPPLTMHHSPLTPPTLKILDMGLALLDEGHIEATGELTTTGQIMGTLDYMPPEQGSDTHSVDIRADVYSLGATLFKLLTGMAPFEGELYRTPIKKLTALANTEPERVDAIRPEVPVELADLVQRMLSKIPDGRPAQPADVARLLAPFVGGAELSQLLQPQPADAPGESAKQDGSTAPTILEETNQSQPDADIVRRGSPDPAVTPTAGRQTASGRPPVAGVVRSGDRATTGRRTVLRALGGIASVVLLGVIVFKFATRDGTLYVELDTEQPVGRIEVDNNEVEWTLAGSPTCFKFEVAPGEHTVRIFTEDGTEIITEATETPIEIAAGGKQTIRAWLEPDEPRPPGSGLADAAAQGPSTDLISQIDLDRDAISGDWTLVDGVLTGVNEFAGAAESSLLHIPGEMPEEYVVEAVVERVGPTQRGRRGGFTLVAPVGDSEVKVVIDGWQATISGLNLVDGRLAGLNPTRYNGMILPSEERVHIRYTVGRSGILVTADGETIIDWSGQPEQLSATEGQLRDRIRDQGGLGLLLGSKSEFRVERLTLTPMGPETSSEQPTGNFALRFDGEDDFVEIPNPPDWQNGPLTIEVFVTSEEAGPRLSCVLRAAATKLRLHRAGVQWMFIGYDEDETQLIADGQPAAFDVPVHLAGVWEDGSMSLFVNGQLRSRHPVPAGFSLQDPLDAGYIGASAPKDALAQGNNNGFLPGVIDEVRISSTARYTKDFTPEERFESDEHTLALYHFDKGEGNVLIDSSSNECHGTIHGATWVKQVGPETWAPYDADRRVAEWVIETGGLVQVRSDARMITANQPEELPPGTFELVRIEPRIGNESAGIQLLDGLEHLEIVDFNYLPVTDADLALLSECSRLDTLYLLGTELTAASAPTIAQFEQLRVLGVSHAAATDEFARQLARLTRLEQLGLASAVDLTDSGLQEISKIRSLETLTLHFAHQITGEGLSYLASLENLTTLGLTYIPFDAPEQMQLPPLPSLDRLELAQSEINDEIVSLVIDAYPNLWRLGLSKTPISDDSVPALTRLSALAELDLVETRVTEDGIARLREALPECRIVSDYGTFRPVNYEAERNSAEWVINRGGTVDVMTAERQNGIALAEELPDDPFTVVGLALGSDSELTDDDLSQLSGLASLESISLHNSNRITDAGLVHLRDLPSLKYLDLGGTYDQSATRVSDHGMAILLEGFPALIKLSLQSVAITDEGLEHLSEKATLQVLHLHETEITDDGIRCLQQLPNLSELRLPTQITDAGLAHLEPIEGLYYIDLAGCRNISEPGMRSLARLPRLHEVRLRGTALTDDDVQPLADSTSLRLIRLEGSNVTEAGAARLREALPDCRIVTDDDDGI